MKIIKSFRIEKELVDRLEKQAESGYESQTDIIENALRKYFNKRITKQS
jgi:metal-responsive CopG/Arc/MetJ family transcriptional regulator